MPTHLEQVIEIVSTQLGAGNVAPAQRIVEDLGAESMDIVNIIAALEERFSVAIDESELPDIHTVAELARMVADRSGPG